MSDASEQFKRPKPVVLIVDDNSANIGVVAMGLDSQGYQVLVAEDGDRALERARRVLPDLILLDVMMPGMDGFEVCRRLKQDEATRSIPVIFMTALDDIKNKLLAFEAGGVDYVTKPIRIEEALARVGTQVELNTMRMRLEENNVELAQHRDNLARMVEERTVELEETNQQLRAEVEERRRAEKELAAREREFRTLAENAPDNIARHDSEGRFLYLNPELETTLGKSKQEALGRKCIEVFADTPNAVFYQSMLDQVITTGQAVKFELSLPVGNDQVRFHNLRIVAERDEQNNIVGALVIGHDVTDFKLVEHRLAESNRLLKEMAQRREQAREDERKHIARELHDDLGQYLTALRLQASALNIGFANGNPTMRTKLEQLLELVVRTQKTARNLSQKLRPLEIDLGIDSALNILIQQYSSQYDFECELDLPEETRELSDTLSTTIYRLVQESLTNIARYANAKRVSVSLRYDDSDVLLEIEDDGQGFDLQQVKPTSYGLVGMRERVQAVAGALKIDSEMNKGTRILTRLPLGDDYKEVMHSD